MKNCTKESIDILIIRLDSEESKQLLVRKLEDLMGLSGLPLTLGRQQDLIISQTYARITKKLVTVDMGIHASSCTIAGITKSGWQLEKEWEEAEKVRKRNLALGGADADEGGVDESDDDDDDDSLPFACFICREPFADPIVTKCKHYFCEHCALKHHSKNKKCCVLNTPTLGIFNMAHETCKKMAEERR